MPRILAIGDAMATDMRGAQRQGVAGLFVTAGIHRDRLHAGRRDTTIDRHGLQRLLSDYDERSLAAMPHLAWRAQSLQNSSPNSIEPVSSRSED